MTPDYANLVDYLLTKISTTKFSLFFILDRFKKSPIAMMMCQSCLFTSLIHTASGVIAACS